MKIIHLIEENKWLEIKDKPLYFGDSLKESGFIHCCLPGQVDFVLRKWFPEREDILLLEIDSDLIDAPLAFENVEDSEEKFPHIYGPINRNAIKACYPCVKRIKNMNIDFAEIHFLDFQIKSFDIWEKTWLLLTSGDFSKGDFNSMVVGWGGFGIMWKKPIAMVVIRPTRHTFKFINSYDSFSLCVFPEKYREELNLLGTKSGRDGDKIKESGLTTIRSKTIAAPIYEQAELTFECRKMYWEDFDPTKFISPDIDKNYPKKDYHRVIFGEIVKIFGDKQKYSNMLIPPD
jgi:uncharacterized protein (DUF952 family)/flavin reductase (DIM6/NTAB) family NADH-FMN oxidoreductase RutF